MLKLILRRIAMVIPTFIGVTVLAFALIHMVPGDPVDVMMGERGVDPAVHAAAMERLGLNKPLPVQYWHYLTKALQGDLGLSLVSQESVLTEFFARFPATLELTFFAMSIALIIGLPVGIIAALRHKTFLDHGVMSIALTGYSMPIYWWGLLLIMLIRGKLGWLHVGGQIGVEFDIPVHTGFLLIDTLLSGQQGAFQSAIEHLILPSFVLATIPLAVIARMTRSSMLEVLKEDYIRTARAKGLSPFRIVLVHALRSALIPVVTVIGLQMGTLLAGAVLTETIFSWPGIGKWLIDAIARRDYPVVQGGILIIATLVIIVNSLIDILYGVVNPRIRHAR
jgi:dipeptide transport system permease protein